MWLYDGRPEEMELVVRGANSDEGGYVVLLQLASGAIRILGTRYPVKYIGSWRTSTQRHDGSGLTRVLISKPHPRYEKIKRLLANSLVPASENEPACEATVESIMSKAAHLFSIAPASNSNLAAASTQISK